MNNQKNYFVLFLIILKLWCDINIILINLNFMYVMNCIYRLNNQSSYVEAGTHIQLIIALVYGELNVKFCICI